MVVTGGDGEVMADREVIDADVTCKVCKVHYSALQCVTVCYSVLQYVTVCYNLHLSRTLFPSTRTLGCDRAASHLLSHSVIGFNTFPVINQL